MYIPEIPNNSLTSNIEQIKELALALHEKRKFVFNTPASLSEIKEWEKKNDLVLSESYIDWFIFSRLQVALLTALKAGGFAPRP